MTRRLPVVGSCASPRVPAPRAGGFGAACLVALLAAVALGGCGSSAKVESQPASVGQQLQDLEAARDQGLLTEAEYQHQRKRILEGK